MTRINRGEKLSKEQSFLKTLCPSDTINDDNELLSKRKSYKIAKKEMFNYFGYFDVLYRRKMSVIYNGDNILIISPFKQTKFRKGISIYLIYDRRQRQTIEFCPKN